MFFNHHFVWEGYVMPRCLIKMLRVMRITAFFLLVLCIQVNAEVFSQNISISGKKVTLEKVIAEVKKQTDLSFILNEDLFGKARPVDLNLQNTPVDEVLRTFFKNQPLGFSIKGGMIRVFEIMAPQHATATSQENVMSQVTITGVVLNARTLEPMTGANINVKGTSRGVATDANGKFSIVVNATESIVVSFAGFESQEHLVNSRNEFRILLQPTDAALKDIVVNGVFTRSAKTATGSQTMVTREQLLKGGTLNLVQSLRNIDPSFIIMENRVAGSNPNALPDVNIRGQSGLPDLNGDYATNPNLPLFILDGFETTLQRIIDLDMYRISTITLLKDAASKSIYGAKAANGVVVVETIRPQPGELRVSYNTSLGLEIPDLSSYNLTNGLQKLEAEVLAGVYESNNATQQYTLMEQYNTFLSNIEMGAETDWMAKPLRNGFRQTHSLRVSGGDNRFTYGVTLNYNDNNGVMKGSSAKVLNGNINLAYRVGRFNFRNDLTIANRKGTNSPWGSFNEYAAMNPYLAYRDINGEIAQTTLLRIRKDAEVTRPALANSTTYNPAYNATLNTSDITKANTFTNNTSFDWMILPGLRANGRFSFTKELTEGDVFLPAKHNSFFYPAVINESRRGSYTKNNGARNNYDGQINVSYSKLLGVHSITLNGGGNASQNSAYNTGFVTEGFPNDRLNFPSLGLQYQLNSRPTGSEAMARDMGFFGSTNYSLDQCYNVDLTYRLSQSSQYGINNRWARFWSTGVSWNLHNEAFIAAIKPIDQLRLRATTGFTGSQGFNTYVGIGSYTYERSMSYSGGNGAYLLALANPDLQWQRRRDHNFGADFGLFKKFSGRADYAISYTTGLLTDITLPTSTGFSSYKANLGKVENRTLEFSLTYNALQNAAKRNFLSFFVSASQTKNKLLQISNSLTAFNKRQNDLSKGNGTTGGLTPEQREAAEKKSKAEISRPKVLFVEGQSMNAIYAVRSLGIDPANGKERYLKADGSTTYEWDVNDQVVVGNSLPQWQGNFGLNMAYGGVRLNATCRFEYGGQIYNYTLVERVENADIYSNIDVRVLSDRWQKPGDVAFFKSIRDRGITRLSSRFVENNNTLTMASLQLGYDLDRLAYIRKIGFSQLRASITSSELFQLSTVRMERGTSYPFARTIQFTLNANF